MGRTGLIGKGIRVEHRRLPRFCGEIESRWSAITKRKQEICFQGHIYLSDYL